MTTTAANMKPKAIFAFSADPIHFGHLDVIKRASNQFDVTVLIANSSKKTYLFTLEERLDIAKEVLMPFVSDIQILPKNKLTIDFAYENDIKVIIRGIRNVSDWDYEKMLRDVNVSQQHGVETYFLSCNPSISHISSSAVKELFNHSGFIHEYVPLIVKHEMEKKAGICVIGVTGSIASGKSWYCQQLLNLNKNIHHIDMDKLAHFILFESDFPLHQNVRKTIRNELSIPVTSDTGAPFTPEERKQLGNLVFSNVEKRKQLNTIMYQPLLTLLRQTMSGKMGIILLNAALLVEFNLAHVCNNQVVLVTTDEQTRINRMEKRGYSPEQIKHRIASQYDNDTKEALLREEIKRSGVGYILKYHSQDTITDSTSNVLEDFYKAFQIPKYIWNSY